MVPCGYRILRDNAMKLLLLLLVSLGASAQGCEVRGLAELRMHRWQHTLGIRDWTLTLDIAPAENLKPGRMGESWWVTGTKTALIRIVDRSSYSLPCGLAIDLAEAGILHELVHVSLSGMFTEPRTEASKYAEEEAVVRITTALLDGKCVVRR